MRIKHFSPDNMMRDLRFLTARLEGALAAHKNVGVGLHEAKSLIGDLREALKDLEAGILNLEEESK